MRRRWIGAIGLGCAVLAGCATTARQETVSTDKVLENLSVGQPLLRCREPCLTDWRAAQPKAQSLAAAAKWRDLVTLLAGIGYQDDLSLYYLGEAAEGLGYAAAAMIYYRQSAGLSGTSIACGYLSKQCGGVSLPQAAQARIASLNQPAKRPRLAPASPGGGVAPASTPPSETGPAPASPPDAAPAPPAAAATETPAAPAITPLPADRPMPPAPPIAPPPLPRETAVPRAGEDYIEPPPARR